MAPTTDEVAADLQTHEAVCAERYGGIIARLGRLERVLMASAGALIVGMGGLIVTLALKGN